MCSTYRRALLGTALGNMEGAPEAAEGSTDSEVGDISPKESGPIIAAGAPNGPNPLATSSDEDIQVPIHVQMHTLCRGCIICLDHSPYTLHMQGLILTNLLPCCNTMQLARLTSYSYAVVQLLFGRMWCRVAAVHVLLPNP